MFKYKFSSLYYVHLKLYNVFKFRSTYLFNWIQDYIFSESMFVDLISWDD